MKKKYVKQIIQLFEDAINRLIHIIVVVGLIIFFLVGLVVGIFHVVLSIFLCFTALVSIISISVAYGKFEDDITKRDKRLKQ